MQFNTSVLDIDQGSNGVLNLPWFFSHLSVSSGLKAASLMLTKMVHHTLQRERMSLCSTVTHRSLEINSDLSLQNQVDKEMEITECPSFRICLGSRIQAHSLQTLNTSTLSLPLHYSPTPPTLLKKHFLVWFGRWRKGTLSLKILKYFVYAYRFYLCLYRFLKF